MVEDGALTTELLVGTIGVLSGAVVILWKQQVSSKDDAIKSLTEQVKYLKTILDMLLKEFMKAKNEEE